MKKLFVILMLGLFSLASFSQNQTVDKSLGYNKTYSFYVGQSSDTLGSSDSTWTYTINKLSTKKTFCNVYIEVDTLAGTTDDECSFILEYKAAPGESIYTTANTVTYFQSEDTTFNIQNTTAVISDYWRIRVEGSTDDIKSIIKRCDFKIVY